MFIDEIVLVTADIQKTKLFYGEQLGLPVTVTGSSNISYRIGRSILSFKEVKDAAPLYHIAFSIPNNQLNGALDWIRERTAILPYSDEELIADFVNWNAKAFYFHDREGNILECITHYDRGSFLPGTFTTGCFESIIEIGIPVDDVTAACAAFNQQNGIPYFSKGPRLPVFAVMGDEDGMLIVTQKGRGWLPTQQPAEKHFMQLKLTVAGRAMELQLNQY